MSLALELPGVNLPTDFEHLTAKLQRPGKIRRFGDVSEQLSDYRV
jgi:hypothetical protein